VPIVGVLLIAAVLVLSSGLVGTLWRSANSPTAEDSAPVPATTSGIRRPGPARRAAHPAPIEQSARLPEGSAFAIQVASFRTERKARAALAELQGTSGLTGVVVTAASPQGNWYRVLLGGFATQEEAAAKSQELLSRRVVPADRIVVRGGAAPAPAAAQP
jgi:cell division septation protein DedD